MVRKINDFNYFVDEDGNVYNGKGRRLKPRPNTWGYAQVILCKHGVKTARTIHDLVMEAFVGPKPKGCDTDHINFDRADNRLVNLRYVDSHWNRGRGRRKWVEKAYSSVI